MPVLRALLSDLDGTLANTEPLYYDVYLSIARDFGREWSSGQHVVHLLGKPQSTGVAAFLQVLGLAGELSVEVLIGVRDERLHAKVLAADLMPGSAAAILACKTAGLECAIVTSSKRSLVELKTARHGDFMQNFSLVVCNDDKLVEGKPGKPHPACYLAAAAALGVPPAECLVWEDSLMGIKAGVDSGCFVVAIPDPRIPMAEVRALKPHLILSDLTEFSMTKVLAM